LPKKMPNKNGKNGKKNPCSEPFSLFL